MPPGFSVKMKISKKGPKRLRKQRQAAQNLRPAMQLFGAFMVRSTQRNFDAEGRLDGATGVWPALSDATLAMRREGPGEGLDLDPMILQDTGRLKSSITFLAHARSVEVGTDVEYAPDHQQGGAFGAKKEVVETVQIEAHERAAHLVKEHQRRLKDGRVVTVKAHNRPAVTVKAHSVTRRSQLPARPFLRFHLNDKNVARNIINGYIEGGTEGAIQAASRSVA